MRSAEFANGRADRSAVLPKAELGMAVDERNTSSAFGHSPTLYPR